MLLVHFLSQCNLVGHPVMASNGEQYKGAGCSTYFVVQYYSLVRSETSDTVHKGCYISVQYLFPTLFFIYSPGPRTGLTHKYIHKAIAKQMLTTHSLDNLLSFSWGAGSRESRGSWPPTQILPEQKIQQKQKDRIYYCCLPPRFLDPPPSLFPILPFLHPSLSLWLVHFFLFLFLTEQA